MRMLAPILFGGLLAVTVGLYTAQLVHGWMQQADHSIVQVRP